MDASNIIDPLNQPQRLAVTSCSPYSLILAGAGSGKTRVLTHRIAWLLKTENISPYNILAVTFTNKAAHEMRERLNNLLDSSINAAWVGTFHGLAHRFLRIHWQEAGLIQNFQIMDSQDQTRSIKRALRTLNLDDKKWPPKQVQGQINSWKDLGLRPSNIDCGDDFYLKINHDIYQIYEQQKQLAGLIDFADLLLFMYETILDNLDILAHYQHRFKHILVDEFQDTNTIQYAWIKLLAGEQQVNVFVVGDDDQSIYGWRGAQVSNILNFAQRFKPCQTFKLEQNYRSTNNILNAANAIIANNSERLGKNLWTEDQSGDLIKLYQAYNDLDEADFIINSIKTLQQENFNRKEIAILYRSNAQSRLFEERLISHDIPYQVYGGLRFFERAEIKDALAYLRLIANPYDDIAFERVVNRPVRGIGNRTVEMIRAIAQQNSCSLWQASGKLLQNNSLPSRANSAVDSFLLLITMLKTDTKDFTLAEQTQFMLKSSGLLALYEQEKFKERGEVKLDNLKELVNACKNFTNDNNDEVSLLDAFLTQSALEAGDTQGADWDDCVQLMSLHSAKGLEFSVVFLTGLEEGLFPHQLSSDNEAKLAEERRLCYVGITRSRQKLILSFADSRRVFGTEKIQRPSRFIAELPTELIEEVHLGNYSKTNPMNSNLLSKTPSKFSLGQQVLHSKFGLGIIINAEGSGNSARLQINFSNGTKWLVTAYANLKTL